MRIKTFFGLLLLVGCVKHVQVHAERDAQRHDYILAADRTWAYYPENSSSWIVLSKAGATKAQKELCPHGYICTTEEVAVMYRIRKAQQ